jgi:hypothetical protein
MYFNFQRPIHISLRHTARKKHTVSFLHHPVIDSGEKVARNATQGRNEAHGSLLQMLIASESPSVLFSLAVRAVEYTICSARVAFLQTRRYHSAAATRL